MCGAKRLLCLALEGRQPLLELVHLAFNGAALARAEIGDRARFRRKGSLLQQPLRVAAVVAGEARRPLLCDGLNVGRI